MLEWNSWTHVPGAQNVQVYPILRKPSIACSSTFLLKAPGQIIVIDPGADLNQVEQILRVISPMMKEENSTLSILLTHCHVDHFLAIPPLLNVDAEVRIMCHDIAARALEERDTSPTMANMIDIDLPECRVGFLRFFAPAHAGGQDNRLKNAVLRVAENRFARSQIYPIGEEDAIEVFHTPGHSPDSISFRLGRLLFTGDLHLATTPGIAGLTGWNNTDLASSLEVMVEAGRSGNVEFVLPGHGIPFPFAKAEKIFESVRAEAFTLSGLATLNRKRADYLSDYASLLLEETSSIFSIIAARLLKISHYLELLEEEGAADAIRRSIDFETIEKMIDEFHYFTVDLQGQGGVPLIAKAVQFARNVNKAFAPEGLRPLFDIFLLRRLTSLLLDFVNEAFGIRFRGQETVFNVPLAVKELLAALLRDVHGSLDIFDALDDDEQYVRELVRRIAFEPLFAGVSIDLKVEESDLAALADRLAFQDCLSALLEQYAVSGVKKIRVAVKRGQNVVLVVVTETPETGGFDLRETKLAYLNRSMNMAGGTCDRHTHSDANAETSQFILRLPAPAG